LGGIAGFCPKAKNEKEKKALKKFSKCKKVQKVLVPM